MEETVINSTADANPVHIEISTNPVHDILTFRTGRNDLSRYVIVNQFGKVVREGRAGQGQVDCSELLAGVYFFIRYDAEGARSAVRKYVKR